MEAMARPRSRLAARLRRRFGLRAAEPRDGGAEAAAETDPAADTDPGAGAEPGAGPDPSGRAEPAAHAEPSGRAEPEQGSHTEPAAHAEPAAAAPEPASLPPAVRPPEVAPTPLAAIRRGLGERPAAGAPDQAAEAELDTLRGELVRELDRLAGNERRPGS